MAHHEDGSPRHKRGNNSPFGRITPFDNPCGKEQDLSYQCLNNNGYDKDKCTLAFANFQACKDFWNKVRSERRVKGIYPYMPGPEERKIIQDKYKKQI